jgi:glycosyltransferase involved in cell wall biosynthesis
MALIYLDALAASDSRSGTGRYAAELIPELARQAPQHEFVVLLRHRSSPPPCSNIRQIRIGGPDGSLSLLASAPVLHEVFRRQGRPDLYHALFHLLPLGISRGSAAPGRVVVTLHDLIWIDHAREVERTRLAAAWLRRFGRLAIPYALRTADHVICNSATTAASATRFVPPERCTVIHHGVSDLYFDQPPADTRCGAPVRPYVAAFGVAKPYKNIECLVRAFGAAHAMAPDLRLVLIGGDGGAHAAIERLPDIIVTPSLPDDELRELVRGALALVVPSKVEGFGLPVCEAMALGTPVVTSNAPALREVGAGATLTFDASDSDELARLLIRLAADAGLRREMSERGRTLASGFRWPITGRRTLDVYDRVLGYQSRAAAAG